MQRNFQQYEVLLKSLGNLENGNSVEQKGEMAEKQVCLYFMMHRKIYCLKQEVRTTFILSVYEKY